MKVECGQTSEDRTTLLCHRGGGECAENAEGNKQGMPEIVVQLEDDNLPLSPETESAPENDIFLFAPVSDIEDEYNYDSDSSSVPLGTQQTTGPSSMNVKKELGEGAEGNYAIPRTDLKPRLKKTRNPSAKQKRSASTNGQAKRRGKKKSQVQPCKSVQAEQDCRMSGGTAGWIPAPYTKPEMVISPQTAMEPPSFPSHQGKMEEPFCDKRDNILLEVLKYCQTLCTVVQRLEQKIDSLQADCSRLYLHVNKEKTKEEWQSAIQRLEYKVADLQSQTPTINLRDPNKPCSSSVLGRDQPPLRGGNSHCEIPSNGNIFTCGLNGHDSQPDGDADKAAARRTAQRGKGGGRRGRRQGKGRTVPLHDADDGPCASKVAKILSELQRRRSAGGGSVEAGGEATKSDSNSNGKEQQVMIGSAFRKVWIPYSVYMEAFKQEEPQKAVVPVLHAVFPQSVLSCSAVIGNPQRGIQELSPNKLEAIREWLAEMYPRHELEVKGKAWAECLGVLNSITKKLKSSTASTKNALPEVP